MLGKSIFFDDNLLRHNQHTMGLATKSWHLWLEKQSNDKEKKKLFLDRKVDSLGL